MTQYATLNELLTAATTVFVGIQKHGLYAGKSMAIETIHPETGNGLYTCRTQAEIEQEYGPVRIMTWKEFDIQHDEDFRSPPTETTEEDWYWHLEVLPPENWVRRDHTSTFKMCERQSGDMAEIFAHIDGHYFKMVDTYRMPHDEIVAACRQVIAAKYPTQN